MRYVALGCLIVSTLASTAHAQSGKARVYGEGTFSCGKWLAAAPDAFIRSNKLGWVTAAGYYDVGGDLKVTDSDAISAWIENYCRAHPLDSIAIATAALVEELARKP